MHPLAAVLWLLAATQAPTFEDLARRAEAALDSRPAEAAGLYRKALGLQPKWAEGWLYLGAAYYQTQRYAEASDAFRKGLRLSPENGTAWAFLGMSEAELDNAEQAIADIRKGVELGLGGNWQFEVAARVTAARMFLRSSAFGEALEQLRALALKNENSRPVVETMGLCALGIPEVPEGKRDVVLATGAAAWTLANQRPAEAAAAYRELLARYPVEPGVRYAHGQYLLETDMASALAEFKQEAQNNPAHWPALLMIASLEVRQGQTEPAIQALEHALKLMPPRQRWIAHTELGRALMSADRLDAAIPELETGVRLMPFNASVRFLLAQAYRQAGRAEDAEKQTAEFRRLRAQQDPLAVPGLTSK